MRAPRRWAATRLLPHAQLSSLHRTVATRACPPAQCAAEASGSRAQGGEPGSGSVDGGAGTDAEAEDPDVVKSRVIFRLVHAVSFGQQIKVVGDGPALGNWDINAAPSESANSKP